MRSLKFWFMVLVILSLSACNLPSHLSAVPVAGAPPILPQVITGSDGRITPTPFQPLPLTPTVLPTGPATSEPTVKPTNPATGASRSTPKPEMPTSKTWEDYPGPTEPADVAIPPPAKLIPQPAGQINILLLGSDQRPYEGGMRTDTIILVTINKDLGTVSLTSYPRDLYVYIPGWTMQRINTAFQRGGWETMQLTFEYNFGVVPDYYAVINFWSFVEVVNSLGGLNVEVAEPLTDHRDGYGDYTVWTGTNYMDGETALWYVRARYTTDDFARTRRQQEVLTAIFQKILSPDIVTRAPDLYDIYVDNVTTDLTLGNILPYLPLALKIGNGATLNQYFVSRNEIIPYKTLGGAQVLLPVYELIEPIMRQALNAP